MIYVLFEYFVLLTISVHRVQKKLCLSSLKSSRETILIENEVGISYSPLVRRIIVFLTRDIYSGNFIFFVRDK